MPPNKNIFCDPPISLPEELIENVFQTEQVRIERIVSTGQSSPPDFWYDQPEGEWVVLLRGWGILEFQGQKQLQRLFVGDYVYIPPHRKHRVLGTCENPPTVWLAVFVKQPKRQWNVRQARLDDIPALKTLYRETITTVCAVDYNAEQIRAWSATAERTGSLAKRIESQYFIVAGSENGEIVGFASFEEPDYLDMMYVHKDYQHQGVGHALLSAIREKASEFGATRIVSEVSLTARPFFEKHGFRVLEKQIVRIDDVELTNYKMEGPAVQAFGAAAPLQSFVPDDIQERYGSRSTKWSLVS